MALLPRSLRFSFACLVLGFFPACKNSETQPPEERPDPITGLLASEAKQVLAEVGSKSITLGDYAHTLARMDEFERLRYQTPERRAELLEEMIDTELLAQEATRRGLDRDPEVQAELFLALRDEMFERLRAELPALESFNEKEVQDYYQAHQDEFAEPERRRALVIVLAGQRQAESVLAQAKNGEASGWGVLVRKHSLDRRSVEDAAPELAGDLGFVSAPGQTRGQNPDVPESVREALFSLESLGSLAPAPVEADGRYYVVKHGGTSPARARTLREAERTIRIELRRQLLRRREADLLVELRAKYPVEIRTLGATAP